MPRSDPISLEVLESLPDGILALNPSGGIDAFNQHLASLWHLPADVLDGRNAKGVFRLILPQLTAPRTLLTVLRPVRAEPGITTNDTLGLKDDRVIERHSQPLADQETGGRVWTFRDTTIRTNVEGALNEELYLFDLLMESLQGQ
jgi:PAS domain-containing protein